MTEAGPSVGEGRCGPLSLFPGDTGPILPPPDDETLEPAAPPILLAVHRPHHCPGLLDEQLPEVPLPRLLIPNHSGLPPVECCRGTQPRRALAPVLECGGLPDGGNPGGRCQGASPLKRRQPLTRFMLAMGVHAMEVKDVLGRVILRVATCCLVDPPTIENASCFHPPMVLHIRLGV